VVKERCSTDSSPLLIFHQNIFGLKKKTVELINSLFPKFPHISCFSEHHLKQTELEQINLEGYKLGAAYCRKSLLKGGVCIFVHKKYNYSNVDLSKYCKEQDIEACAIKLELTAFNIYVVTVYRAPYGNFNSFLNGLDSIIKSLCKLN
jgi:exonuclease III